MTNTEILERAIEIAIKNGWKPDELTMGTAKNKGRYVLKLSKPFQLRGFVLSLDFARSLWKSKEVCMTCGYGIVSHDTKHPDHDYISDGCWKLHLQQMVISEDPIKYLGENI